MFVYNSGKIDYFCSNTCEKNLHKLKRKPLQTKWTEAYRLEHKKGNVDRTVEVEETPKEKKGEKAK